MIKTEWYRHWRELRLNRPKVSISLELNSALKDTYGISLSEKEMAKYDLIARYECRVSQRLLQERGALKAKGEKQARIQHLVYKKNSFLVMVPKDSGFSGSYYPLPVVP